MTGAFVFVALLSINSLYHRAVHSPALPSIYICYYCWILVFFVVVVTVRVLVVIVVVVVDLLFVHRSGCDHYC